MSTTAWYEVTAVAVVLALLVFLLIRVRLLAGRVGAFECALRPAGRRRWMGGVAVFGDDEIMWYRLVSLWLRPKIRLDREAIELGQAHHRGGSAQVVEVPCRAGDREIELGMREDSFSALVSWLESAAPTQPALF